MSPGCRIGPLLSLGLLIGCADGEAGSTPGEAGEASPPVPAPGLAADRCAGLDLPAVVGGAVGDLRIGMPVDEVRRRFPVADTTITAEGQAVPILLVDVGGEAVHVNEMRGVVYRIVVTGPCLATPDGIRVGTPVSRFAAFPDAWASWQGVAVPIRCGLFFPAGGIQHRRTYYAADELAELEGARVTGIVVIGGCPLPLLELRLGERSPGIGLRPYRHAITGEPAHLRHDPLASDPDFTGVDLARTADGLVLSLSLTDAARARLARGTGENAGRLLVVMTEGRVVGAEVIRAAIGAADRPVQVGLELPPERADELAEKVAARWP